ETGVADPPLLQIPPVPARQLKSDRPAITSAAAKMTSRNREGNTNLVAALYTQPVALPVRSARATFNNGLGLPGFFTFRPGRSQARRARSWMRSRSMMLLRHATKARPTRAAEKSGYVCAVLTQGCP